MSGRYPGPRAARNAWDRELAALGHRLQWGRVSRRPLRFEGICTRCGGAVRCGNGPAAFRPASMRRNCPRKLANLLGRLFEGWRR